MRKWIVLVAGCAMLVMANIAIYDNEQLLADGRVVLLDLTPVDPRSLMQGDYMALRFQVSDLVLGRGRAKEGLTDGRIVLKIDTRGVGDFARFDNGIPLVPDEVAMRYRIRNEQAKFATNAFFFQEGHAERYAAARYGEFRVGAQGKSILTGLRGEDLAPLGRQEQH